MAKIDDIMREAQQKVDMVPWPELHAGTCMICGKTATLYERTCKPCFKNWMMESIMKGGALTDEEEGKILVMQCMTHGNLPNNINYKMLGFLMRKKSRGEARKATASLASSLRRGPNKTASDYWKERGYT